MTVCSAKNRGQGADQFFGRILAGKKSPKFGGNKARALRLRDDLVQHVPPGERAGSAQESLDAFIMDERPIIALLPETSIDQAGERARGLRNVFLGVMPLAEGKQFHDL